MAWLASWRFVSDAGRGEVLGASLVALAGIIGDPIFAESAGALIVAETELAGMFSGCFCRAGLREKSRVRPRFDVSDAGGMFAGESETIAVSPVFSSLTS